MAENTIEIGRKISVVYYDRDPVLGERSINSLGAITPMKPREIRVLETERRVEIANAIAAPFAISLKSVGVAVRCIALTGSVASGFASPQSDIDFEVEIEGEEHTELTPEYFERDYALKVIALGILDGMLGAERRCGIDVHLANSFQDKKFRSLLEDDGSCASMWDE